PIVTQGLGGDVAIIAQNLQVVDSVPSAGAAPSGTLQLSVGQLNDLGAQRLILGASVSATSDGDLLSSGAQRAQTVEFGNRPPLSGSEILAAASEGVVVDSGAAITATGQAAADGASHLLLPGGGALLRVSSGKAVTLAVDSASLPQSPTGSLTV